MAVGGNFLGADFEPAINMPNNGCISNLPAEAIVEVPSLVDAQGVTGLAVGSLPEAIAATLRFWISMQELTVDAAIYGDRHAALQVLAADPQVRSLENARALLGDLLTAHAMYLPQFTSSSSHGHA